MKQSIKPWVYFIMAFFTLGLALLVLLGQIPPTIWSTFGFFFCLGLELLIQGLLSWRTFAKEHHRQRLTRVR